MRQFMIENQGIQTFLVYTLTDEEIVDEISYETVHDSHVPGILPIFLVSDGTERMLKFNISSRISLEQFFSGVMDRAGFLRALISIVHTLKVSKEYMLDERYFLLDSQHIYVNVGTREAELLCIPTLPTEEPVDIVSFLRSVVFQTQFDPSENANYVAQIIRYLDERETFSIEGLMEKLMEIVEEEEPSLKLFQEGRAKVTTMDFAHANQPEPAQSDWTGPVQPDYGEHQGLYEETTVLNSAMLKEKKEPARPITVEEPVQKKGIRTLRELFGGKRKKEQTIIQETNASYDDESPVSFRERESNPYQDEVEENIPVQSIFTQAYIKRLKTREQIVIDKQVFKIGKERTFVDYCIVDNPTVSRSHANIVMENDEYYIIDMNSKNHTYVNGRMIPSGTKTKLIHGSRIKLSNEEFEFFLQS